MTDPQQVTDLRDIIEKKRDGGTLSTQDIDRYVAAAADSSAPEVQLASMLMAIFTRGLTTQERTRYALAMMDSGATMAWGHVDRVTVDKHSTGGVGDKVSLIWGPLMAAAGFAVPMISGRGLGHTGGTLDKLEAIPGYRTDLSAEEMDAVLQEVGCVITGQTAALVPADRTLYDLRSRTGTVPTVDHIAPSIMSKKLAEGAEVLVLDVKMGSGAFMKNMDAASELARVLVDIGKGAGRKAAALITDMSVPLGLKIGNALEVEESVDCLRGGGPADLRRITLDLAVEAVLAAGAWPGRGPVSADEARELLGALLDDGSALRVFADMVRAQGGDVESLEDWSRLGGADEVIREPVLAPRSGLALHIDALDVGMAADALGGGRGPDGAAPHPGVGVVLAIRPGQEVIKGQPWAWLVHRDGAGLDLARERLQRALEIVPAGRGDTLPALVRGRIGAL